MSYEQTIIVRLEKLEREVTVKTEEIRSIREYGQRLDDQRARLEDKVWSLLNDNLEFKKENLKLKEELKLMKKKIGNLEQDTPAIKQQAATQDTANDTNYDRISALKNEVQQNDTDVKQKILNLASKVNANSRRISEIKENKTDVGKKSASPTSKVDNLEVMEKKNEKLEKDIHALAQKTASQDSRIDTVVSTVNQLSGLHRILNRAMVDRQAMSKKVDDIAQRTKTIETRQGNISQSITSVELSTGRNLSRWGTKLDRCVGVYVNRGAFDQMSGCMIPHCDGDYGVGVLYRQDGGGEIGMYVDWDGSDHGGHWVGLTNSDEDVCFGMEVVSLKKGQKVWVEARRWEGEAKIGWCRAFFWLLG